MGAVGEFRHVAGAGLRDFRDDVELGDVRETRGDAQFRRRRADAPGHHEDEALALPPVRPVDRVDGGADRELLFVRHVVVPDGVDVHEEVHFLRPGHAHGGVNALEEDVLLRRVLRELDDFGVFRDLQGTALERSDAVVPFVGKVDGELDVDGVIVLLLKDAQDGLEVVHQLLVVHDAVTGDVEHFALLSPVQEHALRVVVVGQELALLILRQRARRPGDAEAVDGAGLRVDRVDDLLGILVALRGRRGDLLFRVVAEDDARVGTLVAVDRRRAEAHDEPQHAGVLFPVGRAELVGRGRVTDTGGTRQEVVPVPGAGHALDKERHLLVPFVEAAAFAVVEGRFAHGTGIDDAGGVLKLREPFFDAAVVRAEDRLVLSGERVAETVLQDGTGTDDVRVLPVVLEHAFELLLDLR